MQTKSTTQIKIQQWLEIFKANNFNYQVQRNPYHVKIVTATAVFDVWPSTGKWALGQDQGSGLESLLQTVRRTLENEKAM